MTYENDGLGRPNDGTFAAEVGMAVYPDGAALRRAEHGFRDLLDEDPGRCHVRVELAWCLFLQALPASGCEAAARLAAALADIGMDTNSTVGPLDVAPPVTTRRHPGEGTRPASVLLTECVRQMVIVMQLTTSANDRLAMERLRDSIGTAYGDGVIASADTLGHQILVNLTTGILRSATDAPRPNAEATTGDWNARRRPV